jgi:hypothetical protein
MATSTLIKAVAKGLHLPETTVAQAVRRLRDADEMDQGASGRGGVPVSARDASRLMMSLCTRDQLKNMAQAVRSIRSLPLSLRRPDPALFRTSYSGGDIRERALAFYEPYSSTFGTMLEAVLVAASARGSGRVLPEPVTEDFYQRNRSPYYGSDLDDQSNQVLRVQISYCPENEKQTFAAVHFGIKRLFLFTYVFGAADAVSFAYNDHLILVNNGGLTFIGDFGLDAIKATATALRD